MQRQANGVLLIARSESAPAAFDPLSEAGSPIPGLHGTTAHFPTWHASRLLDPLPHLRFLRLLQGRHLDVAVPSVASKRGRGAEPLGVDVERVQELAVDVELHLLPGAVAHAYRPRVAPTTQMDELQLRE